MGLIARSVVRPSKVMVLLVHRGLLASGVGFWAVVVVVGLVVAVVVVVGVVGGGALVAVVVMVLWVRPQDPLGFWWGVGFGHYLQPLGLHASLDSGGGFGAGLDGDRG